MKRSLIAAGVLAAFANAMPAQAGNWVDAIGTEPADAPKFRFFGFVQPTYTYYLADRMSGGNAQINGQYQPNNLVGPNFDSVNQVQLLRAQFGARGNLTDKINYFLLTDVGRNLTTVQHPFMVTDASLTFNFIPGARIRAGLFKLPTGEEALVPNPTHHSYVYYSAVTSALVQETFFKDVAGTPSGCTVLAGNISLDCGQAATGNNAFRDWGVQVFDSFLKDNWEFAYAAMLSNGNEIESIGDNDDNKDLTLRGQVSYIFGGKGANREDVYAFAWRQDGKRSYGTTERDRIREGVGFRYNKSGLRISGEYIRGEGMIAGGPNPATIAQKPTGLTPPYNLNIALDGKARGWYLESGWKFHPSWEIEARYDEFDRSHDDPAAQRIFKTWTLGAQYFVNKNTRVTLNYEWRDQEVPHVSAITNPAQQTNALVVADNTADRVSLQLTYWW